jgi:nitroreductase
MTQGPPSPEVFKLIGDLVRMNRSYRRFDESHTLDRATLLTLVDLARCSASAKNLQPLKYRLACDPQTNAAVFACLAWAGYLPDWAGPAAGERPTAYIIMLTDTAISSACPYDCGIAAQSILLGAAALGLGGCIVGSVNRARLGDDLGIPRRFDIVLVLAVGKPAEEVRLESIGPAGDIRYWRDDQGIHHVPKRALEDLIIAG